MAQSNQHTKATAMTTMQGRTKKSQMHRDKHAEAHTPDTHRMHKRAGGASKCPECGAICDKGRWSWSATFTEMRQLMCPACHRIHENVPAGEIIFDGDYLLNRRDEVVALLNHQAASEQRDHPLEKIMDIDAHPTHIVVHTTGSHMVRRIGVAMLHAHHGHLEISYRDDEGLLRAHWERSLVT
jgi:hypothetical protein